MLPMISGREGDRIKIEVTVDLSGGMLEAEEAILRAVNAVGNVATAEALKRFDADGEPIVVGGSIWYSKGKLPKIFNTPYGVVSVERHVYQPAEGGKCRGTLGQGPGYAKAPRRAHDPAQRSGQSVGADHQLP